MANFTSLPAPSFLEEVAGATGASPNVFGLGTSFSATGPFTALLLIALIGVSIIFELGLGHMNELPPQYEPIVDKIKDEFLLMGAVSFCITVIQAVAPIGHRELMTFEYAHLLVFFATIALSLKGLANLLGLRACKQLWVNLEFGDNSQLSERYCKLAGSRHHCCFCRM